MTDLDRVKEATVFVNGVRLSEGRVMTLRVALSNFAMEMVPGSLGEDAQGIEMSSLYRKSAHAVLAFMMA